MIDEAAASELDALRVKYKAMVEENNALSIKVICVHQISAKRGPDSRFVVEANTKCP